MKNSKRITGHNSQQFRNGKAPVIKILQNFFSSVDFLFSYYVVSPVNTEDFVLKCFQDFFLKESFKHVQFSILNNYLYKVKYVFVF